MRTGGGVYGSYVQMPDPRPQPGKVLIAAPIGHTPSPTEPHRLSTCMSLSNTSPEPLLNTVDCWIR